MYVLPVLFSTLSKRLIQIIIETDNLFLLAMIFSRTNIFSLLNSYVEYGIYGNFITKLFKEKKQRRHIARALKKSSTCDKHPSNTQKIDCESAFFGFPIYFCFSAFVPPMQPSIFFFDSCLA